MQDKYLHILEEFSAEHHLPKKLDHLFSLALWPKMDSTTLQASMETFDCLESNGM